jgi:sporadic carbohydrate cluster protein (TIGR04323 family)
MNKVRGYVSSRHFMGERVPQHIQNQVIRDYCNRNQLQFLLSSTEYAMQDCHLILEQVLCNLDTISGIVAYSLFQLPKDQIRRKSVYEQCINKKKALHFAVEGIQARSQEDCERIEMFWRIRLTLPHCPQAQDINT